MGYYIVDYLFSSISLISLFSVLLFLSFFLSLPHGSIRLFDLWTLPAKHALLFPGGVRLAPESFQGVLRTGGVNGTDNSIAICYNSLEFYMYSFLELIWLRICLWSSFLSPLSHCTHTFHMRGIALSHTKSYYNIVSYI